MWIDEWQAVGLALDTGGGCCVCVFAKDCSEVPGGGGGSHIDRGAINITGNKLNF